MQLSADQVQDWTQFLVAFPLESLASEYADTVVADGQQLTFTIRRGEAAPRVIHLANTFQAALAALCDRLAPLVPATCVARPLKVVGGP